MANCPYCRKYFSLKKAAISHIEKYHSRELEQSGMDAAQSLYFSVHGKITGSCCCGCSRPTEWNAKTGKPYKVSPDPECRARLHKIAQANLMNARGVDQHTLMSDMAHQKAMQKNRKISDKYTFKTDGGSIEYMGKLELNWLKFCDTVLDLPSRCIQDPPQNFIYYDSKDNIERIYMPDFYMPDYNLIVEIKDGGDHPNSNPKFIEETKYKVAMKDEVMKKQTDFNYIRISGTNYGPFLETLYQIVHEQKDDDTKKRKAVIVITESACSDSIENINWNQDEEIDVDRIRLLVGYIEGTIMPAYYAISDSRIGASWYVTDCIGLRLYQAAYDDPIFAEGGYRIYKYTGDKKNMQDAFRIIIHIVEAPHEFNDILDIMGGFGICFDDGLGNSNNLIHKSHFVLLEEYFMTGIRGEEE